MTVPNTSEIIIQEFLLVGAADLSDLGDDVSGSDVGFVFGHDAATIGITVWLSVLGDALFNVLVIVSQVFFLLDETLLLFFLLLFFSLFVELGQFLLLLFFFLLVFDLVLSLLLFLLGILWTVDPLDMGLGLVVLVHEGHDLVELCFILSFLLCFAILSPDLVVFIGLHIGNFNGTERLLSILFFVINMQFIGLRPLSTSMPRSRSKRRSV